MSDEADKYKPDSLDITPELALQDALRDLREHHGKRPEGMPDKALIVFLWDDNSAYGTRFYNAGMKSSECVALLEVMKARFVNMILDVPKGRDVDE